jgi:hypothetical protein
VRREPSFEKGGFCVFRGVAQRQSLGFQNRRRRFKSYRPCRKEKLWLFKKELNIQMEAPVLKWVRG